MLLLSIIARKEVLQVPTEKIYNFKCKLFRWEKHRSPQNSRAKVTAEKVPKVAVLPNYRQEY